MNKTQFIIDINTLNNINTFTEYNVKFIIYFLETYPKLNIYPDGFEYIKLNANNIVNQFTNIIINTIKTKDNIFLSDELEQYEIILYDIIHLFYHNDIFDNTYTIINNDIQILLFNDFCKYPYKSLFFIDFIFFLFDNKFIISTKLIQQEFLNTITYMINYELSFNENNIEQMITCLQLDIFKIINKIISYITINDLYLYPYVQIIDLLKSNTNLNLDNHLSNIKKTLLLLLKNIIVNNKLYCKYHTNINCLDVVDFIIERLHFYRIPIDINYDLIEYQLNNSLENNINLIKSNDYDKFEKFGSFKIFKKLLKNGYKIDKHIINTIKSPVIKYYINK